MPRFMIAAIALAALAISSASACDACSAALAAAPSTASPSAKSTSEREKKAREVWENLVKHCPRPEGVLYWPPPLHVWSGKLDDGPNAFATVAQIPVPFRDEARVFTVFGWTLPVVIVTRSFLDLVEGDEDTIAFALAHELGHHFCGHLRGPILRNPKTVIDMVVGHGKEIEADEFGATLMRETGYSLREGLRGFWAGLNRVGGLYSSVRGTCLSHPATSARIARLSAQLDKEAAARWRQLAGFENGAAFLEAENYAAAEKVFLGVICEFPNCREAWANLGFARLMLYCEGLSPEDLKRLGVGQFIGMSHFRTAPSLLECGNGTRAELWERAVADLRRAEIFQSETGPRVPRSLVLANLALAYSVHPDGKAAGQAEAARYQQLAEAAFNADRGLSGSAKVSVRMKLSAVALAVGDTQRARDHIEAITRFVTDGYRERWPARVRDAVAFNTAAIVAAEGDEGRATLELKRYLESAPKSGVWWTVAYQRYEELCQAVGNTAKPASTFSGGPTHRRPHLEITLASGKIVHLGDSLPTVLQTLGQPSREAPSFTGSLRDVLFDAHGIELVADKDEVFAVRIVAAHGPHLVLRETGLGGRELGSLRVGMTRAELEGLAGVVKEEPQLRVFGSALQQHYYSDLGVAVQYDGTGPTARVKALLLIQVPGR